MVSGEGHLRRILKTYAACYNEVRIHLSLDKDAPQSRPSQKVGSILTMPILGGLHHQYARVRFLTNHNCGRCSAETTATVHWPLPVAS